MCNMCKRNHRPLHVIAQDIKDHWQLKANCYALPYINAMLSLTCVDECYGCETGNEIVLYCLCNMDHWCGEDARRIKAELKVITNWKAM